MIKLSDLKPGDIIIADGGFTCMHSGPKTVQIDELGLYVSCFDNGERHYLDGQVSSNGELVGFT